MRVHKVSTQNVKASEARQQWSQLLNRVFRREVRVIVEKSGIPVAAIISAEDLDRFAQFEADCAGRATLLDKLWEAFKDVPPEKLEREATRMVEAIQRERDEGRFDAE